MKKLLHAIITLAYLIATTTAHAGFVINSFSVSPPPPATISFVGCTADTTDQTTYTFISHATGTAGTRKTIVGVGMLDSATDFSTASVTVGGSSATEIIDSADIGALVQNSIYIINNPSGTTATIVVTASEAISSLVVCVFAAYDVASETATDTATQFQTGGANVVLDLNVLTDGIGVGMSSSGPTAAVDDVWTGFTERVDATAEASSHEYSAADTITTGAPLTVGSDWATSADSIGVSASFR